MFMYFEVDPVMCRNGACLTRANKHLNYVKLGTIMNVDVLK